MKSGIRTTELWVTILTDVGVVASALQGSLPAKWAAIAVAVANVAYAVSRGLAKSGYLPPAPVVVVDPGPILSRPMPLRDEELILVREMLEEYRYAKRARVAGARMWSKGERMLVAVLGVLMLTVNVASLVMR